MACQRARSATSSSVDPALFPEADYPVHCSKCQYLLTGLLDGPCPECGQPFERGKLIASQYAGEESSFEARCWVYRCARKLFLGFCWVYAVPWIAMVVAAQIWGKDAVAERLARVFELVGVFEYPRVAKGLLATLWTLLAVPMLTAIISRELAPSMRRYRKQCREVRRVLDDCRHSVPRDRSGSS